MSSRPRCVFDTNVMVSAALYGFGNPGKAFDWALDRRLGSVGVRSSSALDEAELRHGCAALHEESLAFFQGGASSIPSAGPVALT